MNIAIFSTTFFPQTGGAERFIHGLASELQRRGEQVVVIAPLSEEIELPFASRRLRFLGIFPGNSFFYKLVLFTNLVWQQMRERFDVIQVIGLYPAGSVALWLKRIFPGVTIVGRATGSDVQIERKVGYGMRLSEEIDCRLRSEISSYDFLVANSKSVRAEYLELGAPSSLIKIISNAVDRERFAADEEKKRYVRKKYCGNENARIILSVGRVEPKKNYPLLIKALYELTGEYEDLYGVIVGGGAEHLRPLVQELSLSERVILTGTLPRKDRKDFSCFPPQEVVDLYMASSLFVLPSVVEGQPNVLLEALAAGLPIVAANAPGSRDVVTEEVGYLVSENSVTEIVDRCRDLLFSDEKREKMSRNAKEEAQRYTWNNIGGKYKELYGKLLKES